MKLNGLKEDRLGAGWRMDSESKWVRLAATIHDHDDEDGDDNVEDEDKDEDGGDDGDGDGDNDEESRWVRRAVAIHDLQLDSCRVQSIKTSNILPTLSSTSK